MEFYSNWCWLGTKGTWFAGGEGRHGRVKLVLRCYEPVWKTKLKVYHYTLKHE